MQAIRFTTEENNYLYCLAISTYYNYHASQQIEDNITGRSSGRMEEIGQMVLGKHDPQKREMTPLIALPDTFGPSIFRCWGKIDITVELLHLQGN